MVGLVQTYNRLGNENSVTMYELSASCFQVVPLFWSSGTYINTRQSSYAYVRMKFSNSTILDYLRRKDKKKNLTTNIPIKTKP